MPSPHAGSLTSLSDLLHSHQSVAKNESLASITSAGSSSIPEPAAPGSGAHCIAASTAALASPPLDVASMQYSMAAAHARVQEEEVEEGHNVLREEVAVCPAALPRGPAHVQRALAPLGKVAQARVELDLLGVHLQRGE